MASSKETSVAQTQEGKGPIIVSVYKEPLDSPGLVPAHFKRTLLSSLPFLEILQRLAYRLQPGYNLDKVLALIALYKAGTPVYEYLRDAFLDFCTSCITIPEHDPVFKEILAWMSSEVMSKTSTTKALIMTGGISGNASDHDNYYLGKMAQQRGQVVHTTSDEVQCMPPIGRRIFWVGFRPFLFRRSGPSIDQTHKSSHQPTGIVILTLGWSLQPLQDFMKICHDLKLANKNGTTTIFFPISSKVAGTYGTHGRWQSVTKAVRRLDTIEIDDIVKADLVKDAEYFYSQEAQNFYADCGIPYRYGYLFHGPPGTGKTSFSAALAGHLNCDLYMINLAAGDVSDGKLLRLFLSLPRKCVVVIEDIDSTGIGREQDAVPVPTSLEGAAATTTERRRSNVTLSGLLNAIDGNASQEGRLLIMTSNNPEALDEALIRPGRVDKEVYFGNVSPSVAIGMFLRLVGRAAIAKGNFTTDQITPMAMEFSAKLPADTFTPAQVQNFLQMCRGDPNKAIAEVDDWAAKTAAKSTSAFSSRVNDKKSPRKISTKKEPTAVELAPHTELVSKSLTDEAELSVDVDVEPEATVGDM
ncbi:P-loop containing nucleoside triphosphate hydrolase protein [Pleomassaria siparia CBS 279.74]|uniref:P-loop containing nucleoside triphosphate hydrolase protein n=1 Tax=Pleomassaria siparia CBS 279.74 TaxID=1314801 RepID=A0A6G1JWL2_9PLEO|nr:P-loop containing nucleoside triphosphate hydrolase protein [Pleomassaria siparia CBS 279.74]